MKLVEVEKVEWINKKSYSTIALVLQDRDYRILLRTNEGLEDWFELLEVSTQLDFFFLLVILWVFLISQILPTVVL